jgi:hypothetical protein
MKTNFKINFNKEKLLSSLGAFWKGVHNFLFFCLLALAILAGALVWRQNLYTTTWSESRVAEFKAGQNKGVVFSAGNYQKALEIVNQRSQENAQTPNAGKDFFN